jgi:hypothetical protein
MDRDELVDSPLCRGGDASSNVVFSLCWLKGKVVVPCTVGLGEPFLPPFFTLGVLGREKLATPSGVFRPSCDRDL